MATYSYASIIRDSQRARWSLEDVTDGLSAMDFSRPFLPEPLVHVGRLGFLEPEEHLRANQIRAHGYLQMFAVVERFILPFVMLHAGNSVHRSSETLLALMQFGEEEAKHIALFEKFSEAFELGFGTACEIVGPSYEIAAKVLAEEPLAVALAVLHIEWMTQEHYLKSVRGRPELEEHFKVLLRSHWVEEAQHARLDALLIEEMTQRTSARARHEAIDGYLRIGRGLAALFETQVELDIEAFERAARPLRGDERDQWRMIQRPALCEAFLWSGVVHPRFREITNRHFPDSADALDQVASEWVMPA